MLDNNPDTTFKPLHVIGAIFAVLIVLGGIAVLITNYIAQVNAPTPITQTIAPAEQSKELTKAAAVEAVQAVDAPSVDTAATSPAPVAPEAPAATLQPAFAYAAEMSAAGIAPADQSYVTDMVLGDHGWRTVGPGLWKYATRNASEGLFWNLQRVDHYVAINYGSWAAAHDAWVSGGDF
ncbi:hypothetical protein E3O44_12580 [Cryobacterium algoricola]|uniref:Lytic transglycosylase domain-containing protein n=1 Tax=Cryobacterium algoricola TaxID=1259183 RepID=A0ABY2IDJ1_9MICO|nr:hypothetical protein [Cryobacterium algoricola]TFB85831.1 hypothetical protein E3O44_12580 [Cryobacterium algoricola]